MNTTNTTKVRGRPRRFDPDAAVATAQHLFRTYGYDAVSVADITEALDIKPPSFYAAFGSKAGLYARVLERYAQTDAIPFTQLLRMDRPVAESLAALLEEAARRYAADRGASGCLVLEGRHCIDPEAREASRDQYSAAEAAIRDYIATRYPDDAERMTDLVSTIMSGLSAQARNGQPLERLLATARLAGQTIAQALPA
ncbi:MAG TPA: TetR/AcrR family transcriptional regulator [Burkholderiaceae bacterium]|nr:TetR/AcrR family transcriptional regulator [Burkholderiaceae bacterium]